MTTKNIEKQMKTLNKIVPEYVANNEQSKFYKKLVSDGSTEIKNILQSVNMDTLEVEGYKVSVTHIDKSYMDMDKVLAFIKAEFPKELQKRVIKTCEYVDEDVLESIMYKNEISDETKANMSKCMVEKTELRLNVKKMKEGEKDDD